MDLKCGVAVSQDGVRFGRLEGSEADGSLLAPDPDSWERKGAPYGWPAVCEDPQNDATLMRGAARMFTPGGRASTSGARRGGAVERTPPREKRERPRRAPPP